MGSPPAPLLIAQNERSPGVLANVLRVLMRSQSAAHDIFDDGRGVGVNESREFLTRKGVIPRLQERGECPFRVAF